MEQFQQLKQVININDIRLKTTHIQYNETEIIVPVFSLMKLAAFNAGSIVKTTPNYLRPIMLKHLSAKALQ
jgi:hypothetical protein